MFPARTLPGAMCAARATADILSDLNRTVEMTDASENTSRIGDDSCCALPVF